MTWRAAVLTGTLLLHAAVLPAGPAAAQTCEPPSAEHAFEELLDVAEDDSPVEDEAWRIADQQETRGVFESPETIRMIDELAQANGLRYDCTSRLYLPVSGPDPRIAIENGDEPPETGNGPGVGPPVAGAPQPGSATAAPGSGREPVALGSIRPAGAAGGVTDPAGTPVGDGRGLAPVAAAGADTQLVSRPDGAPDGQGGAVALPEAGQGSAENGRMTGLVLLGAAAVMTAGAGIKRRRHRPSPLVE